MIGLDVAAYEQSKQRRWQIRGEMCRRSLYEFTKRFWPVIEPGTPFIDSFHIKAICDHLQAVHEGIFTNLIICIPPGFAKSTIVSVMWPTWTWVDMPWIRLMVGSYDEELTHRDSVRCRDIITSKKYQRYFKPEWQIKGDVNSKGYFSNTLHGARRTYYMRSSHKTGWRCQYMVVDDPLSAEHRYDKNIKQQAIETWDKVLWSRVNRSKHHAFVVIMQRLADDDLVGHILEKHGDRYVKLILPNEFEPENKCITPIFEDPRTEPGELLCPQLLSAEKTAEAKITFGPVDYGAQYQHRPIPAGGDRFKSSTFLYWKKTHIPYMIELNHKDGRKEYIRIDRVEKFISGDLAAETKTENDFTCFGLWALTNNMEIILLDRVKIKENEKGIISNLKSMFADQRFGRIPPGVVYLEANGVGKPIAQNAEDAGLPVVQINVHKDPRARTATAVVRTEGGQVFFPDYDIAPWMHDFTSELLGFPAASHNDQVSMFAIAANSVFEHAMTSPRSVATINPDQDKIDVRRVTVDLKKRNMYGGDGNGWADPINRR